ncbi:MAG: ABC transporter permease [Sphingomonadales bacterium]|nr:ABC transporter permease [Sphingomonadales bacterium]MBD3772911.1 ABC transporter permease [Paracoccaceae bacterium]
MTPEPNQGQPKARLSLGQAAFVVARRDFHAILFSRAFLFFLLGPVFMIVIATISGSLGNRISQEAINPEVGVAMSAPDTAAMLAAHEKLATELGGSMPPMSAVADAGDPGFDPRAVLEQRRGNYAAIVTGTLAEPVLTGPKDQLPYFSGRVALVAAAASGKAPVEFPSVATQTVSTSAANERTGQVLTAQLGQMLLFLLTMLLAGMVLSNLVEEKANKIIEILAAAIPMDAVFFGKLFAMLGVSLVGIGVWGSVGGALMLLAGQSLPVVPTPAVGWPAFLALGVVYFGMAYLLLGSLFLSIGSMAATVREVQTLSMPVTMLQLAVFFFASYAMSQPGSAVEWGAVIFPFSSPFAMLARAAQQAGLAQHLVAIVWQGLSVTLLVRAGGRMFRKRVMKSGNAGGQVKRRWWNRRTAEAA